VLLLGAALMLTGCHTTKVKEDATPEAAYQHAATALANGDYANAVKVYEALNGRFPFTDVARQSRLDIIYAYYKQHEKESAVDAVDSFIRENPTHPRIDYAYYMKGLVYFERDPNILERSFDADLTKRPPQDTRKSFEAFQRVVTQYPHSEYAPDARQRMIYLRNRLADYELHVAHYYMRRGAWVGALDRSRYLIENYDGAPATHEALVIMAAAYRQLGMADLAADAQKAVELNVRNAPAAASSPKKKKHWWQFGR